MLQVWVFLKEGSLEEAVCRREAGIEEIELETEEEEVVEGETGGGGVGDREEGGSVGGDGSEREETRMDSEL
eukprot:CAMPEP_0181304470 /NCGR_PEP_ID=MMETSP1101-20121128/9170_1 /TAXON_ID=46948 /ORGANISM="Rhodomonas abbreviata, Strain Caron Lab Isolate" /LENGTH=71 /DNA_ID=CAMNT_0023410235 /DNA_START=95 /DNA_END=308 /DNA_ORIENTATION=-